MTDALDRQIRTDIAMQVAARDREIHLLFNETDAQGITKPAMTSNFLLSAADAMTFSSLLADLAFEADAGLKIPDAQKKELVARHRETLRHRIRTVLNSTRETKYLSNETLAQQIVDIVSAEVFQ
jgi:hypothetical protein